MKAIIIDDEQLALDYLEQLLLNITDLQIVGKYLDPFRGKEAIENNNVDIVFLDIQIPEINGIELAEQLLEMKPKLSIVFVTAYDNFAIKAFELNALDYILKPVRKERLLNTVERIKQKFPDQILGKPELLHICMFQQGIITDSSKNVLHLQWRTNKVLQLFLYLVHHRGTIISKAQLVELLWREYEPKKAFAQLYTAIYHIRKTLGAISNYISIKNISEGYLITLENVDVDVDRFENFIQTGVPISKETIGEYERVLGLYKGEYLQGYDYLWAESERQRLQLLWVSTSLKIVNWYFSNHELERAVEIGFDIISINPLVEEAYFLLMKIFASMNNRLFVHQQYQQLIEVLNKELNVEPNQSITYWYNQWKENRAI
ncbi:response regulator [Heyndrickxia oleronia]|uniref:Response regulator n=1 Tax=Heyndrickxia oleronia TaxID=38875 RepID=A0AAW6T371_9BACI|nr:response regulator [Heyndrickxia oleronia]MDH5163144.1 response regulator [Heyndrickxia oleronia]